MREKTLNKPVGPADQRAFLPALNGWASRTTLVKSEKSLGRFPHQVLRDGAGYENPAKTLRAVLLDALQQMDADTLGYTLRWCGFFGCVIVCVWFYLVWKLAALWKGCV